MYVQAVLIKTMFSVLCILAFWVSTKNADVIIVSCPTIYGPCVLSLSKLSKNSLLSDHSITYKYLKIKYLQLLYWILTDDEFLLEVYGQVLIVKFWYFAVSNVSIEVK